MYLHLTLNLFNVILDAPPQAPCKGHGLPSVVFVYRKEYR